MSPIESPEALCAALQRALAPVHEVKAVWLFGSHARGTAREDSDIDVAILLDRRTPAAAPASCEPAFGGSSDKDLVRRLLKAIGKELRADRIDLVLLDRAPPKLRFEVLRSGVLAHCKDRVAVHRFTVRAYSAHADYEPVERFFRQMTRERALKAVEGG